MTALTLDPCSSTNHDDFLAVMPRVSYLARRRFAYMQREQREDAVAEAIAAGFVAYLSMKRRGRLNLISTVGFARNAVRHVVAGRHVGSSQASCDVMSELGRRRHGCSVQSLMQSQLTTLRDVAGYTKLWPIGRHRYPSR